MNFTLFAEKTSLISHLSSFFTKQGLLCLSLVLLVFPVYAEVGEIAESSIETKSLEEIDTKELDKEQNKELRKEILKAVVEQLAKTEASELTQADSRLESSETTSLEEDLGEQIASEGRSVSGEDKKAVAKKKSKSRNKTLVKRRKKQPRKTLTQDDLLTADYMMNISLDGDNDNASNNKSGWIYIGLFTEEKWLNKTLNASQSLPKVGRNYTLLQALNLRSEPPLQKTTAQLIKNLKEDDGVKILKVQRSGNKGHYWAKVELISFH